MKSRKSVHKSKNPSFKTQKFSIARLLAAFLLLAFAGLIFGSGGLFPASPIKTSAQTAARDDETISPEALNQIAALIREKESRTDAQKKIDSRLLYRLKMERGAAVADGVATLKSDLKIDENGFIELDITAEVGKTVLAALEEMRAEIVVVHPQYRSILARVPLAEIENLAARPEVFFIQPKSEATTNQMPENGPRNSPVGDLTVRGSFDLLKITPADFQTRAAKVERFIKGNMAGDQLAGSVVSQADTTHRAALARTLTGFNGAGLKIGVLSDGVNTLAARQATGDLPASVTVLAGQAGSGDEGTAMLELVHDLAPGAELYFATALPNITTFAQNIKNLRSAGCDIIIDDVSYFVETPFQNGQAAGVVSPTNAGVVVQAVNDVTVGSQAGALYFSSAGNSGNKNDNTSGVWEGDFVDGGATSAPLPAGHNVHNFGGGVTQNVLTVNGRVLLKWSDPLGGSANDYDLYVLNSAGTAVVASSTNVQSGTQDSVEDAGNCFANERIVIVKKAGAANRFLHLNTNRGRLSVSTSGVVYGHNAALNTISVAATPAGPAQNNASIGPFPNAHSADNVVEQFSSDGPRRIFYNADGTPITPGNVSSTGGQILQKPDITAADGTSTTTPGFIPFFGTSAAAPHAGAIMALVKQANPGATRTQLYDAMVNSAIDIEAAGTDRDSGAGVLMPLRAMNSLGVTGPALLETGAIATTELFGNGNGRIEPGESANLIIPLNNLGLTSATGITATLSTSTPGVTLINTLAPEALSYPNLPAAVGSGTPATPFRFGLAGTFPCNASISFTLTVNYTGGTSPSQVFNFTVSTGAPVNITTTLDTTAPAAGNGYTAATGTQTGRLVRNGVASTCAAPKTSPGQNDATAGRRYDAYTFSPSASGCTTVTLTATTALFVAAYNSAGFVPGNTTTNYLADAGSSFSGDAVFSFNAVAGQSYTIVVHEVTVGGGIGANYTLNVSGPITGVCALAPTAANVSIAGRVATSDGRMVRNAVVSLVGADGIVYVGRTNSFGYYVIENVPAGEVYTATVRAKGLTFNPQIVNVSDSVDGLDFTAQP